MKNTKLIPFALLAAMLTACSSTKVSMKKYSHELSYEEWSKSLEEIGKSDSEEEEEKSVDLVSTIKLNNKNSEEAKVGKTLLGKEEMIINGTMSGKFDADNSTSYLKSNVSAEIVYKTENGSSLSEKGKLNNERYYQILTVTEEVGDIVKDVEKTISIDKKQKQYFILGNKEMNPIEMYAFGTYGLIAAMAVGMMPLSYENASEEAKADYKFYVDGKLYTIVYSHSEEEEKKGIIDGQEVTYANEKSTTTTIVQAEYTIKNGKATGLTYRYKTTNVVETTYLMDYSSHLKDEILVEEEMTAIEVNLQQKSVNIAPTDISNYLLRPKDVGMMS